MNTKIKWILITASIACIVTLSYKVGYSKGHQGKIRECRVTMVAELTALQDIRTNNFAEAVHRLESHCYSETVILLEQPDWKKDLTVRQFMPELISYRASYAADEGKWTYTEKLLEELLKKKGWKN